MLIFKKMTVVSLFLLAVIFLWPKLVLAQDSFGLNALNNIVVYSTRSVFSIIAGIVNIVLGFLGTITVLLFLYAGWLWLTSRGVADRIDQAKKIMINATIGIGIIFISYALVNFIFRSAYEGIFGAGPGGGPGGTVYYGAVLGGALDSHYPASNAVNIARNTNIIVTFREPINLAEILFNDSCDPVYPAAPCAVDRDNIMVYVAGNESSNLAQGALVVNSDTDHKNFVFSLSPVGSLLGSDSQPVIYTVRLNNLRTGNGLPALVGGSYYWSFSVGTWVDIEPPFVSSVIPVSPPRAPRNTIVQINFSESISPLEIPAISDALANIRLTDATPALINGTFHLSNQYKTIEFISNDRCGTNSCGYSIFCLPAMTDIIGQIEDELRDMAGNRLDGNHDGVHDFNDDYSWQFQTDNTIDLIGPIMTYRDISDTWSVYAPIRFGFDSALSGTSVNRDTVKLAPLLGGNINYWVGIASYDGINNNSVMIYHDPMSPNTQYSISCLSGVTDLQQNCYQPCDCPIGSPGCGAIPPAGIPCPASGCP